LTDGNSKLGFHFGVLRHVVNDMDAATFNDIVRSLMRDSSRSPFLIVALNIPLFGAVPILLLLWVWKTLD